VDVREIRAEAERLEFHEFADWPDRESYTGDWKVFGLFSADPDALLAWTCAANARRCPETTRLVHSIPGVLRAGFSLLLPGAHIHLHGDEIDDRIRSHLALRVNEAAGMRFGDDVVRWTEGRVLVAPEHQGGLKHPGLFVRTVEPYIAAYARSPDLAFFGWPNRAALRIGAAFLGYEVVRRQELLVRTRLDGAGDVPQGVRRLLDVDDSGASLGALRAPLRR
jgi:hypothetical protein